MSSFINDHHVALQYHPMFAAAYHNIAGPSCTVPVPTVHHVDPLLSSGSQSEIETPALSEHNTSPPYDWKTICRQWRDLDPLDMRPIYDTIIQGFCAAYERIIRECGQTSIGGPQGFQRLVGHIGTMSNLAVNMCRAPSRELDRKLMGGEPLRLLLACSLAICKVLKRYTEADIAISLNKEQRKILREQLYSVRRLLDRYGYHSNSRTDIDSVMHLFEATRLPVEYKRKSK